jgi:N-acetylgalactosamine-6-sulfatase
MPFRILLLIAALFATNIAFSADTSRPNIILLLADDMGYADLSCFGSPAVKTPHLDRLAAEGIKSTHFHSASAVCSPTRASILTGQYPLRFNVTRHFNDVDMWLPESAYTLAEMLQDSGYETAHIGKWHLGGLHVDEAGKRLTDQPGPHQHGFKHYQTQIEQQPMRGQMGRDRTVFRQGGTVLLRNDQRVPSDDPYYPKHFTDANGDFAVELIHQFAENEKPFFLNLWWLVPHTPYEPAPEPHWSNTAANGISDDQHRFRSMVQHMDAKVGAILDALEKTGAADNTLIVFTSDNGAAWEGYIGDLKGGKTDLHEGGLRVPMIARWPAKIRPGSETDVFGHSADLWPTFHAAAQVRTPSPQNLDGINLLPHLTGGPTPTDAQRGTIFWQMQLYRSLQRHYLKPEPYATEVVRRGPWKLLALDGEPVELFDILNDPHEQWNLLREQPDVVKSMTAELKAWLAAPRTISPGTG